MNKQTQYILAVLLLLGANLGLFFSTSRTHSSDGRHHYFDQGGIDELNKILLRHQKDTIRMDKKDAGWILNNQYEMDESFFKTLVYVLKKVEINRKVIKFDGEILGSVEVEFGSNSIHRFDFASNPTGTKSYFIEDGETFDVSVPGYKDNVADIFTLHQDQWRNRLIIDGSWRSIQKVILDYTDEKEEDLEITFTDKFFLVNDHITSDSSALVDYLNQFQYFQANEMISKGRFSYLDSLLQTVPAIALMSIDNIKNKAPKVLKFYPKIEGKEYHLVTDEQNEMMVIDTQRVSELLKNPDDFIVR